MNDFQLSTFETQEHFYLHVSQLSPLFGYISRGEAGGGGGGVKLPKIGLHYSQ